MKKNLKIGPLILIGLGVIFLLNNFGILPWEIWNNLWKFWPVIIILIGIEFFIGQSISLKTLFILLVLIFLIPILIVFNPFTNNPLANDQLNISEDLGNLTKAKIIIDLPATLLSLKSTSTESAKLVEGKIEFSKAAAKPVVTKEETFGQSIITINQSSQKGIPFISSLKNNTDLSFTQQIPLEILIKTVAAQGAVDLRSLRIDYLEIDTRASNLNIMFGNLYSSRAVLKTSASNIQIQIPADLAARIKVDSKVKNLTITDRFKENQGVYKTEGFDKAFTRLDIEIEAVASSLTIK